MLRRFWRIRLTKLKECRNMKCTIHLCVKKECQRILSDLISKLKPLVAFDEKRPLFLARDTSEKAVSAVLYHKSAKTRFNLLFLFQKTKTSGN